MSMIPKCVVCDRPVASIYAPDTHCERCKRPCQTCGGPVQNCQHPLAAPIQIVEVERTSCPETGNARVAA